jgi:hypothetical protein
MTIDSFGRKSDSTECTFIHDLRIPGSLRTFLWVSGQLEVPCPVLLMQLMTFPGMSKPGICAELASALLLLPPPCTPKTEMAILGEGKEMEGISPKAAAPDGVKELCSLLDRWKENIVLDSRSVHPVCLFTLHEHSYKERREESWWLVVSVVQH